MKFNWGHGLTVFFILFIIALVFIVFQSKKVDRSLVVDNYYYKDIHYEDHKTRLKNTTLLKEKLIVELESEYVHFKFPEVPEISGNITFYRASDKSKDFVEPIELDDAHAMKVNKNKLIPGLWTIKIDWESRDTPYYTKKQIYIDP